jgi:hypothetical protein
MLKCEMEFQSYQRQHAFADYKFYLLHLLLLTDIQPKARRQKTTFVKHKFIFLHAVSVESKCKNMHFGLGDAW